MNTHFVETLLVLAEFGVLGDTQFGIHFWKDEVLGIMRATQTCVFCWCLKREFPGRSYILPPCRLGSEVLTLVC